MHTICSKSLLNSAARINSFPSIGSYAFDNRRNVHHIFKASSTRNTFSALAKLSSIIGNASGYNTLQLSGPTNDATHESMARTLRFSSKFWSTELFQMEESGVTMVFRKSLLNDPPVMPVYVIRFDRRSRHSVCDSTSVQSFVSWYSAGAAGSAMERRRFGVSSHCGSKASIACTAVRRRHMSF